MSDGSPSRFSREQKAGFIFLLVFAILTVGLGGLQMRNTIYGPFAIRPAGTSGPLFLDEDAKLQQIDTDQDGINDYEELNFYETSAYLPDTDSDGIRDKDELDQGTDPLCPEGQTCAGADAVLTVSSTIDANLPIEAPNPLDTLANGTLLKPEELETLANEPSALRELLVSTGQFTAKDLEQIDDVTLKKLAEEIISAQGQDNN